MEGGIRLGVVPHRADEDDEAPSDLADDLIIDDYGFRAV